MEELPPSTQLQVEVPPPASLPSKAKPGRAPRKLYFTSSTLVQEHDYKIDSSSKGQRVQPSRPQRKLEFESRSPCTAFLLREDVLDSQKLGYALFANLQAQFTQNLKSLGWAANRALFSILATSTLLPSTLVNLPSCLQIAQTFV